MGKTTQFGLLHQRLESDGKEIYNHHFPSYGTFHGEPVVRYLKGELGDPAHLSPYMINSLYAVDRAIAWNKHLREQWQNGKVILLDRYTTSSLIYQSALITDIEEKKAFIDYVCEFEYEKMGIGKPDDVIFLHAPFDLVTEMRNARKVNDEFVFEGEEVAIAGFGKFVVKNRAARESINPRTKQAISVPASKAPAFRAGKQFKEAINNK